MTDRIIEDIGALAAFFQAGKWDELRVEIDGVSILFSNDRSSPPIGMQGSSLPAAPLAPPPTAAATSPPMVEAVSATISSPALENGIIDPSWKQVLAPNLGTFYRSPKPGAAPFVEVGQAVGAETEICLLEVMKLFTSVKAGVDGTIRRIDAADGQLVEGGQLLFYIEPA